MIGAAAAAALVVELNDRRSVPIADAVNPMFWVRRWQGKDLYSPDQNLLMHGNWSRKEVALTFDDGPHNPTGPQILEILREHRAKATFFVVGRCVRETPDLVRLIVADGHEVGNHTQNHRRLDLLPREEMRREINDNDITFYRVTGRHLSVMRPPGMRYDGGVLGAARELGYQVISWTVGARDFEEVTPDFIVNRVLRRVENGSIILLHDDLPATVAALPRILTALERDGFRCVTVSEMMRNLPHPVMVDAEARWPRPALVAARELAAAPRP